MNQWIPNVVSGYILIVRVVLIKKDYDNSIKWINLTTWFVDNIFKPICWHPFQSYIFCLSNNHSIILQANRSVVIPSNGNNKKKRTTSTHNKKYIYTNFFIGCNQHHATYHNIQLQLYENGISRLRESMTLRSILSIHW